MEREICDSHKQSDEERTSSLPGKPRFKPQSTPGSRPLVPCKNLTLISRSNAFSR
jgi:hypothetical protein